MTSEYEGAEPGTELTALPADVSRVEVWTTAKGAPQWRVRVVVGEEQAVIDEALSKAVAAYQRLERELTGGEAATREDWPPPGGQR